MPALWAWLFRTCYSSGVSKGIATVLGPGTHFIVAGLLRLLGRQIVRGAPSATLFIDDVINAVAEDCSANTDIDGTYALDKVDERDSDCEADGPSPLAG